MQRSLFLRLKYVQLLSSSSECHALSIPSRQLQESLGKPKQHCTFTLWQEVRLTLEVGLSPVMAASHSALGCRFGHPADLPLCPKTTSAIRFPVSCCIYLTFQSLAINALTANQTGFLPAHFLQECILCADWWMNWYRLQSPWSVIAEAVTLSGMSSSQSFCLSSSMTIQSS